MVDHHVDRPEVEAGQPAQLTGTNRSMHWSAAPSGKDQPIQGAANPPSRDDTHTTRFHSTRSGGIAGLVAIARGKTPDPIPNSAVKTLSADGTASQGAEE